MKQQLLALIFCMSMLMGIMPTASAYTVSADGVDIYLNEETYQFWEKNQSQLDARKIHAVNADSWNFCAEFHDGLLLIQDDSRANGTELGSELNYIDKNANLVDLNKGRYRHMFSFSGGYALAAVSNSTPNTAESLVYIDTKGKEITPRSNKWFLFTLDSIVYAGQFENGRAVVLRTPDGSSEGTFPSRFVRYDYSIEDYQWSTWPGLEYAYIDATGKLLTKWTFTKDANTLYKLPLYDRTGVWIGSRMDKTNWGGGGGTPPVQEQVPHAFVGTYGQSTVKAKGYAIEDNKGYLIIDVTNTGKAADEGDLFYVLYNKYGPESERENKTDYLPGDYIRQIHYQVDPGKTKTLRIGIGQTGALGRELTESEMEYGWYGIPYIADSRFVLAQAESAAEATELAEFFKTFHYFGEMQLSYTPNENGVTYLAAPGGTLREAQRLDEKLSAFTQKF